jgi:FkbM family methyltransferase
MRRQLRLVLFQWVDLKWQLPCGLRVRLKNYPEWLLYNEIFVQGEYDQALRRALETASAHGGPIHIVDLGAHVGFFTLRALHQLVERRTEDRGFMITAVEGDADRAKEFEARILADNELSQTVRLARGLVGNRSGEANLYGDSLFRRELRGVAVPFIDLDELLSNVSRIDLLKCDIEGAELLFIENYPELLRKVSVAVFELHSDLCDTARCRELLTQYGFTHAETDRAGDPFSVYCVWR